MRIGARSVKVTDFYCADCTAMLHSTHVSDGEPQSAVTDNSFDDVSYLAEE